MRKLQAPVKPACREEGKELVPQAADAGLRKRYG
jgi:hypothetical protein